MPAALLVVCSGCQTRYQVPPVLAGKKIRCKNCGGVIPVPRVAATAKPVAKATPKPQTADAPAPKAEEWGQITAYEVITEKDKPRCPHCAHDMDEGEIVCLNCGYNTMTRERLPAQVLEPVTGSDYFMWLLPGIICAVLALFSLFMLQSIFTRFPYLEFLDWMYFDRLENKAIPSYMAIFFIMDIWGLSYFAVKRLILNPHPPDVVKHLEKTEDDDE